MGQHQRASHILLLNVQPAQVVQDPGVAPPEALSPHHHPGRRHLLHLQPPQEIVWGSAEKGKQILDLRLH